MIKKIKNIGWSILAFLFIGFFIYKVTKRALTDHLLINNGLIIKAIVINEKNYNGNEDVNPTFSYSYQFEIDRKKYTGNSHDPTLNIGDTIDVEYVKNCPSMNKPLHPKK
jgi:hypothetical protein